MPNLQVHQPMNDKEDEAAAGGKTSARRQKMSANQCKLITLLTKQASLVGEQ